MSSLPQLHHDRRLDDWWIFVAALHLTFLALVGPLTTAGCWWFYKQGKRIRGRTLLGWGGLSLIVIAIMILAVDSALSLDNLVLWWGVSPATFPPFFILFQGIVVVSKKLRPPSLQDNLQDQEKVLRQQDAQLEASAARRSVVAEGRGIIEMGSFIQGNITASDRRLYKWKGWVFLDEKALDEHIFILGATGAGKTETIKRLVTEILTKTDRDIFFVDGKGDIGLANDIRSLAYKHGRGIAPVFRLGHEEHGAIYDGFRGQPADVYNRLCALVGVDELEGNAQYYADSNRDLLQLICFSKDGPPRNFEQVRERIDKAWLLTAYQGDPKEYPAIKGMDDKEIAGLQKRIRPLEREFVHVVGDDGFALEEVNCAIFSMRTQSVSDTAKRLIKFLIEDFKDFAGKRQRRPAVLIIDEFGQFDNENIKAVLTMARSSRLGVILSTQDTATLKDPKTEQIILANTRTKLLMASDYPETVGKLAGTKYQIEASVHYDEDGARSEGSARVQDAFRINMNKAAQLPPGQAYVFRQRRAALVQVRQVGKVTQFLPQTPEKRARKAQLPNGDKDDLAPPISPP